MKFAVVTQGLAGLSSDEGVLPTAANKRAALARRILTFPIGERHVATPINLSEAAYTANRTRIMRQFGWNRRFAGHFSRDRPICSGRYSRFVQ